MMSQETLPFQYQAEKKSGLTRFAGLPLYLRLSDKVGLTRRIEQTLQTRTRGWAEQGLLLHSEFRDGNVLAGFEQLRVFQEALKCLPTRVTSVLLRSDSAGYQEERFDYCAEGKNPRFGVIDFAIAAKVSAAFKTAVASLKPTAWQPFYKEDANSGRYQTAQEWAEVSFVPQFAATRKNQASYRYLAGRRLRLFSENHTEKEEEHILKKNESRLT